MQIDSPALGDKHTHTCIHLHVVNHVCHGPAGRKEKNLEYQLDFWALCACVTWPYALSLHEPHSKRSYLGLSPPVLCTLTHTQTLTNPPGPLWVVHQTACQP